MYPPDAAARDSTAVRQAFFIDQMTASIVIVVLLNSVADVDIGWDGNAHGIAPFVFAYDRSTSFAVTKWARNRPVLRQYSICGDLRTH